MYVALRELRRKRPEEEEEAHNVMQIEGEEIKVSHRRPPTSNIVGV